MRRWTNSGDSMNDEILQRLKRFLDDEAHSGSMDYGCATPLYVYRVWGGSVSMEEIEVALNSLKANNYGY